MDQDVEFLGAAAQELQDYLLSDTLYFPLGLRRDDPPLTPGTLLLAAIRAGARQDNSQALKASLHQIESIQGRWRSAWEKKAGHEFAARLRLWNDALDEIADDPGGRKAGYAQDVRWRVILQLLWNEGILVTQEQADLLFALDNRLRAITSPAPFIWDAALQSAFPKEIYWYLFVAPIDALQAGGRRNR